MKHDMKYRRVLRSKEEYLSNYMLLGVFILTGWMLKELYDERNKKNNNKSISSQMNKIKNNDTLEDPLKVHEKWYFTIFDKRLWFLIKDTIFLSKIRGNLAEEIINKEFNNSGISNSNRNI